MNEEQNIKKSTLKSDSILSKSRKLILYNDDVNTFDYVIDCLIEVCNHDLIQAEQCAFITHYKGKCEVKNGDYKALKLLKENLVDKGLKASID